MFASDEISQLLSNFSHFFAQNAKISWKSNKNIENFHKPGGSEHSSDVPWFPPEVAIIFYFLKTFSYIVPLYDGFDDGSLFIFIPRPHYSFVIIIINTTSYP